MSFRVKSCGKAHPWCKECRPDIAPFGGRPFRRPKGSTGYPLTEATKERIGASRRGGPKEPREARTQVSYRRAVEDYLGLRFDPKREVVHHILEKGRGGDSIKNLAVMPRVVHQAVHTLERHGVIVDVEPFMATTIKRRIEGGDAYSPLAEKIAETVYLPDESGVTFSRWGKGNRKLGPDVYAYSRKPGLPDEDGGTCPAASDDCLSICYAFRIRQNVALWWVYEANSRSERLPGDEDPLPPNAKIVRIHVSGDFSSVEYIEEWIRLAESRPEVAFFTYSRSWRIPELLACLERLRALPNVQLFASIDKSMTELPPPGWRRAWLEDDLRAISGGGPGAEQGLDFWLGEGQQNFTTFDGQPAYVCPEETGRKANCQSCNFCIRGTCNDVVFLLH